jgi:hypothetical protein
VDVLVATINAAVVAAVGLILGWLGKGRIDKLEAHIDRLDERINRVEGRLFLGFDSIRSDLTRVALAVGVRPEAEAGGA